MSDSVISLKHLEKSYGKKRVLNDVNLEVKKGDIYGLVGKNGSGKTTMFKVILGLSEYNSGEIHVGDPEDSLDQGRSKTGFFVGQNFFSYLNAPQNLEYYRRLKNIKDSSEVQRVLELVGLANVKTKVSGFSMGMRQRLGIANAIMGNPELLILDEPANGLDPTGIAGIRELVQKLNEDLGMTILISSHILGELQNTAKTFGVLNQGAIVKVLTEEDLRIANNFVRLTVDDVEQARKVLADAGIQIHNESYDKRSLEDYYFELIGERKA